MFHIQCLYFPIFLIVLVLLLQRHAGCDVSSFDMNAWTSLPHWFFFSGMYCYMWCMHEDRLLALIRYPDPSLWIQHTATSHTGTSPVEKGEPRFMLYVLNSDLPVHEAIITQALPLPPASAPTHIFFIEFIPTSFRFNSFH